MRSIGRLPWIGQTALVAISMALVAPVAWAQAETSFSVSGRYTAQRKPRVTVLEFENTNSQAQNARYGASVQAMLVTFLKRKSQFVVVERQKLGDVLQEWQRNQKGLTNLQPTDPTAREMLEKIDAIVLGNVTLLDTMAEASVTQKASPDAQEAPRPEGGRPQRGVVRGQKIEIDAKLLSRADGRIIAAAQRSGPVSCLRSIVERLGIALEQEFLRPYYGKLKINLTEPEYVRVFLTPILLDTALDEEKPPTERNATVSIGGDRDVVESWTTDPTSYTIENLLSGWYSMRLQRPGYEELGTETSRWEAREAAGAVEVYDRAAGSPLAAVPPDLRRFVVRVDPLKVEVIDGDARDFQFRKKVGTLDPRVKRQYRDDDFSHQPQRVLLIGKDRLEINSYEEPHEYAEDETCDLFEERPTKPTDYGRTYVAAGEQFDISKFKGGELIFDNYQGEALPAGIFQMTLWEPNYQIFTTDVNVRDRDQKKTSRSALVRNTQRLSLNTTGPLSTRKVTLTGKDTGHRVEVPLDFESDKIQDGLPVDVYTAATDVPGLLGWRRTVSVLRKDGPPIYDPKSKEKPPLKISAEDSATSRPPFLRVKTRMTLGGRLAALAKPPDATAENVYVDRTVQDLLNLLLHRQEGEEELHGNRFLEIAKALGVAVGTEVLLQATALVLAPGQKNLTLLSAAGAPPVPAGQPAQPVGQAPGPRPEPKAGKPPESGEPKAGQNPKPQPFDPEILCALLAERLEDLDLLVLDDVDMKKLRRSPEVAAVIKRYVDAGGALLAFATDEGNYADVVGAPLYLEVKDKDTNRFEIVTGDVPEVHLLLREKKVKVKNKRALPEIKNFKAADGWRVVAYTKGRKDPRILERGNREQGGYVVVWCDTPASFRGSLGGTVQDVESVRSKIEEHVFNRVRELMQRRFGTAVETSRRVGAASLP